MKAASKTKTELTNEIKELRKRLKEAEEKLTAYQENGTRPLPSQNLACSILNQSTELIILCDERGRIIQTSQVARRFFATKLLGRLFDHVCPLTFASSPPFEPKRFSTSSVLAGKIFRSLEVAYRKGGHGSNFLLSARRLLDGKNILGCLVTLTDITEHKRAEQLVSETNPRLQALMQAVPVGVSFSEDATCRRITGNPAVLAQFEVTRHDNLSASAPDRAAPGRRVRYFCNGRELTDAELPLQRAVAENKVVPPMEMEVQLPGGRRWFAEASGAPVRDVEGNVIGGLAVTVDITERKRAEEALRQNELKYSRILATALSGFWIADTRGRLLEVNDALCRMLGYSREELLTLSIGDVEAAESPGDVLNHIAVLRQKKSDQFVSRHRRKDGFILDVEINSTWLDIGEGQLVCFAQDITGRKRMEEALRQSEERYRSLVESSPDAIAVHTGGRYCYINPAGARLFGASSADEVIGRKVLDLVHPDYLQHVEERIRTTLDQGTETALSESRLIRVNGQVVDVEATGSPILYEGKPASQVIFRDITERKRAEEALRRNKERFELLSETASRLLTTDRPREIVNELCQKVMAHLDCHAFFNYLVDEKKQRLHLNAYAGIPEEAGREIEWLDYGVAVCGCAARDASWIVAEDIPDAPDPRTDPVKSLGIKAYACHPLFSAGRVIGTLSFGTRSRLIFAEDELALMKTVADQVAVAMERIRFIEALRTSHDELELRVHERTVELTRANQELQSEIVERKRTEEALRKMTYDLNQRVKEINCLYSISYYVGKQYILLEEKLHSIVNLIPSGWQYPEITCARIFLGGKEYRSENFKETSWRQAGDIVVRDERIGAVEIYYLEEKPVSEEGPFLREERRLIHAIAVELGELVAHMQAEKALAEQSRILEGFFTSTITPLVFLDRNFNFMRVNEAYARACQRQISDFPGHNHFEFYPSGAKKIFEHVVESKAPYQAIAQPFTFPDDPERGVTYWDWTLTPLLDDTGEVEFLVFSLQDVTERRRAVETVRLQADQHATMLATTPDGFWVFDTEGKLLDVNDAYCRMSGYSRDEVLRFHISDVEAVETPEETARHIRRVMESGFDRFETKHRMKDGRILDVEISVSFWRATGRFLVFVRDITRRRRAQEALRAAHQYNRSLIEASLDPLVMINAGGKITDVNRATEFATGMLRNQLIGSDFSVYFTEPEKAREGYRRVFSEGPVRDYPLAIRNTSGHIAHVLYNATVYKNEEGEIQGVIAAARDITERKRAEEALKESENRLRLLSSQLLTAQESERKRIALELHDGVGQMLTAIKFKVESILQKKGKARSKEKPFEAIIPLVRETVEEVRRMQMDLRPSTLDDLGVLATLGWFCREYQKIYSQIHIEKEIGLEENDISVPRKVVIYRLTQEAMNNIAKHSRADLVSLSLRKKENEIEWVIRDNGMGFDLEEILSPERAMRGLGLASMRERVELSGGVFALDSTIGKGTTLRASWPL